MPIYEFTCDSCRHEFELLCRIGSNGKGLACPRCSQKRLRKRMSTFAARSGSKGGGISAAPSGGGGCSGCSGGNCATCH